MWKGTNPKCCNCGGEHSANYICTERKVAVKVQNVRIEEGVSYAEALKKVKQTPKVDRIKATPVVTQSQHKVSASSRDNEVIAVSFITFVAVVNCSAQTESRTERIKIIIKAVEKYLEIRNISIEMTN